MTIRWVSKIEYPFQKRRRTAHIALISLVHCLEHSRCSINFSSVNKKKNIDLSQACGIHGSGGSRDVGGPQPKAGKVERITQRRKGRKLKPDAS